MKTLSLCMIVKDEEENLDNCLKNAKDYADEIIIVDTGSKDKTKEIAKKYTDKVYDFVWEQDFSKARNYSFDRATSEYIIWLDGDDIILKEGVQKINEWKASQTDEDVIMCKYATSFDENFKPIFQFSRERIVKNTSSLRWQDPVHEVIIPSGKITYRDDIVVYHNKKNKPYTDRNLSIYQKMIKEGIIFTPRQQFYYARELYFNNKIQEAIHELSKYLADNKGWKENKIEACLNLSKCYSIQGEYENSLTSLFGSFIYDSPRGEILYEIGNVFMAKKEYAIACYWHKLALSSIPNYKNGAFINKDCYDFLPALQLTVCYDKLGDKLLAYHYHQIARAIKPNDKSVLNNEKYFRNILEIF